jgi:uncharacterized protein
VNLFADSSALAKRYVADEGSEKFDQLLQDSNNLAVSVLCLPEIISALCRRLRDRHLTKSEYSAAKSALETDLADIAVIAMVDEIVFRAVRLLESHPLRASDAVHISSALVWQADLFTSADMRQCAAAKASGLKVVRL